MVWGVVLGRNMYVRMYIHEYIYIYISMLRTFVGVRTFVSAPLVFLQERYHRQIVRYRPVRVHLRLCVCVCVRVCVGVCTCMHIHTCRIHTYELHTYMHTQIHTYVSPNTHTHTHTHTHTRAYSSPYKGIGEPIDSFPSSFLLFVFSTQDLAALIRA